MQLKGDEKSRRDHLIKPGSGLRGLGWEPRAIAMTKLQPGEHEPAGIYHVGVLWFSPRNLLPSPAGSHRDQLAQKQPQGPVEPV